MQSQSDPTVEQAAKVLAIGAIRKTESWRRGKVKNYPDDVRNLHCADGLHELADYVSRLPDDDDRLRDLSSDAFWAPRGAAEDLLKRFRFNKGSITDCDDFVELLAGYARQLQESTQH